MTTPTDKHGNELSKDDTVSLVYGGDHHLARITRHSKVADVDHVHLHLNTDVIVPAASVSRQDTPKHDEKDEKDEPKKAEHSSSKDNDHDDTPKTRSSKPTPKPSAGYPSKPAHHATESDKSTHSTTSKGR